MVSAKDTHNLGQRRDAKVRVTKRRVDDNKRQRLVKRARVLIYEKRMKVNSDRVEKILKEFSMTPTEVSLVVP